MKNKNELLKLVNKTNKLYEKFCNNLYVIESELVNKIEFEFQVVHFNDNLYIKDWSMSDESISIGLVIDYFEHHDVMLIADFMDIVDGLRKI